MNLDLTGKHALVCGGSQGIGHAAAIELAQLGADVTLLARSRECARSARSRALPRRTQRRAHATIAADMNDHAALARESRSDRERARRADPRQQHRRPAGRSRAHGRARRFPHRVQPAHHRRADRAAGRAARHAAAGYGRIVNVISTSVKEPIRNLGVSNTIRGAMASWAKTLATELGPFGITVNNVLPGYTKTARLEQILADRARRPAKPRTRSPRRCSRPCRSAVSPKPPRSPP